MKELVSMRQKRAVRLSIKERIQKFTGSFLVARNLEEEVVGFVTGPVVDSKYDYIGLDV